MHQNLIIWLKIRTKLHFLHRKCTQILQKIEGIPATGISVEKQIGLSLCCTPSGFRVHKLLQERDSFKQLPRKCSQAVDIKVYKSSGSNTYPFIAMSIKYYKFSFQCAVCIYVTSSKVQVDVSTLGSSSQLNTECAFRTQDRSGWSLRHPIRMGSPYLIIKGIRLTKAIVTTKGLICYQVLCLILLKLDYTNLCHLLSCVKRLYLIPLKDYKDYQDCNFLSRNKEIFLISNVSVSVTSHRHQQFL